MFDHVEDTHQRSFIIPLESLRRTGDSTENQQKTKTKKAKKMFNSGGKKNPTKKELPS